MEKVSEMLSEDYKNQMKDLLKENYEKYLTSLDEKSVRGLRVNTKKISVEEFMKINNLDAEFLPVKFSDDGFIFETEKKIGLTDEH